MALCPAAAENEHGEPPVLEKGLETAAATQGLSGPGPPWQDPGRLGICSDLKRLHVNIPE